MYAGTADRITIESDDRGFELHISTDEAYISVNIQAIAEEFYDHVKASIGPWLYERDQARSEHVASDEDAYDLSDPKSDGYHDRMSAIYDNREGK